MRDVIVVHTFDRASEVDQSFVCSMRRRTLASTMSCSWPASVMLAISPRIPRTGIAKPSMSIVDRTNDQTEDLAGDVNDLVAGQVVHRADENRTCRVGQRRTGAPRLRGGGPRRPAKSSRRHVHWAISQMCPLGSLKLAVRGPHGRSTGPLTMATPLRCRSAQRASTSST